jgi:trehalose transport system permease protein
MPIKMQKTFRRQKLELIFMIPLMAYVLGFTLGPVAYTIFISFKDKFSFKFPVLANYQYILTHFQFREAFANTLLITLISLSLELVLGLFLAVILSKRFIAKGVLRTIVLLPLGVPTIVAASNMRYIFDTQGYLNEILYRLHLIKLPIDWAGGGMKSILSIAVSDMWKVTPLVMLILVAGLESIPSQLIEAARIDGASAWQIFKKITLPLLKPFITIALIIRGIDAFRLFELPLTLVGSTIPVMSTYTYFEYFQYNNPFTSAASAVMLLIMILISVTVYFKVMGQQEIVYQ